MKILVCVKQVPDTSGKVAVNPDGTLNRASMQTIINPDDMNAVEAALKLKDELGCKVTVVTMGPPPAEGMLMTAISFPPVSSAVPILTPPPRSLPPLSTPSVSMTTTSSSAAVRLSMVIPLRSVLRSLRSCTCPRSPTPPM